MEVVCNYLSHMFDEKHMAWYTITVLVCLKGLYLIVSFKTTESELNNSWATALPGCIYNSFIQVSLIGGGFYCILWFVSAVSLTQPASHRSFNIYSLKKIAFFDFKWISFEGWKKLAVKFELNIRKTLKYAMH